MKRNLLILAFVLLVLFFEVACFQLPIMDWFWVHVLFVLAVIIAGVISWFFLRSRRLSCLLLSSGVIAALAGVCTYILYPLFESTRPSTNSTDTMVAVAEALAHALGPIYFTSIAMACGLLLGWLPGWLYLRSHENPYLEVSFRRSPE